MRIRLVVRRCRPAGIVVLRKRGAWSDEGYWHEGSCVGWESVMEVSDGWRVGGGLRRGGGISERRTVR